MWREKLLERNVVPDSLIRMGIRQLLQQRLDECRQACTDDPDYLQHYIDSLKSSPVAVHTAEANEQHYEVPTGFYQLALGSHLKYSCAWYGGRIADVPVQSASDVLDQAEEAMLALTCERAELANGQNILELGCGWGSLSLWMAAKYPGSRITAVSNSATQKEYIDRQAKILGLTNLQIITADMNDFQTVAHFDRIVSIEMFEHMRNYEALLRKVSRFLTNDGKLFVHIFTHKTTPYLFEVKDDSDWMSKYFFTGGQMPSRELLLHFAEDLKIERLWHVNGVHYQKTCEAWLQKMDSARDQVEKIFRETYGEENVRKWWVYWRVFFMACAELFGYNGGEEWFVTHYRFAKRGSVQ